MDDQNENGSNHDLTSRIKTVAIIPAGGSGRRMLSGASKQYLNLNGPPILVHTIRKFQLSAVIDAIFLVVPPGDLDDVRIGVVEKYGLDKVRKILPGGRERQDSVRNGIDALDDAVDIVMIHDGVRPFISDVFIRRSIMGADKNGAVILAVPAKETVKICDAENRVTCTPARERVWVVQTPQTFQRDIIVQAHKRAYQDKFYGTDDAGLVERIGIPVHVIHGSYDNIKITTPDDLVLAENLIRKEEWSL
jgi:2-C-methyl-D-erythritol 4-phosphate cytidylyltransferase